MVGPAGLQLYWLVSSPLVSLNKNSRCSWLLQLLHGAKPVLFSETDASRAIAEAHVQQISNSQQRARETSGNVSTEYMKFPRLAKPRDVKGLDLP